MFVSIYTMTHVPFTPPEDPIYIPLQVGRALHDDLGYQGDDTGDTISALNPYYSELTGLYWVWKNVDDADYLGLCHYRRYFLNENGTLMAEADYRHIFSHYDVILSSPQSGTYDYRTVYSRSHDARNLDMTGKVIQELYPEYFDTFQQVISGTSCYVGNLFAAPKALFNAYCKWLFSIFSVLETRIDVSDYDDYHKRVFGFLSEQLLIVWVKYNQLSYYEAPVGLLQEKAETISLKSELQALLHTGSVTDTWQYLCTALDKRPDLSLQLSDFNQELVIIEHILNVCRIEEEEELPTLLQFSRDLGTLIRHFRLLLTIVEHIGNNIATEEETRYLLDCRVSYKAIVYMMQNFKQLSGTPQILLNTLAGIYANAGEYLAALSFLEEALAICETNRNTLSNIISTLEHMGQPEMAEEYRQLYHAIPRRITVFMGGSIPVLNYMAEQYAVSAELLGCTVFRYDKSAMEDSFAGLLLFRENGLDAAIVFNNVCFQMWLKCGKSLWDLWNIPCYNIIVDHPMYYADTLDHAPENGVVACADRNHQHYISRFYPTVRKTLFLPTAGQCLKPFAALKPFAQRTIDVLFIGAYKYDDSYSYDSFDLQLTEELIRNPERTFEDTVEHCLLSCQTGLTEEELKRFIQEHCFVDTNTGALFRREILRTLVNAGITVTVYGDCFEKTDLLDHPNFIYKGRCSTEEGIRLMEDSKIVLNQLAWFKDGSSERIYEAMLQGAVSLTDDSTYLRETFVDDVDIKFYSLAHLDRLPALVRSVLDDPQRTQMLRTNAYRKAAAQHTWLQRMESLLADF